MPGCVGKPSFSVKCKQPLNVFRICRDYLSSVGVGEAEPVPETLPTPEVIF